MSAKKTLDDSNQKIVLTNFGKKKLLPTLTKKQPQLMTA